MVRENFNQPSVSEALAKIYALKQEAITGGSVDSESSSLEAIANKLRLNTLTPEQAIKEAEDLIASRQDYH